jgi:hypothetical protein
MRALVPSAFALLACACGPRVLTDDAGGESTGHATTTGASTTSASTGATSVGSSATTTTTTGTSGSTSTTGPDTTTTDGSDEGCNFICPVDDCHYCGWECDIWAQDCARGEKCMPWANDGGTSWNATKCVPIAPDPKQPGEPCTVEGSGVSGVDDCDIGSMCWNVDPDTNMGTCIAMCTGTPDNPMCAESCDVCTVGGDSVLALCLPGCDPLGSDCPAGQACIPIADEFGCAPDGSGALGAAGDPCEFVNACDPGLFCASADILPDCDEGVGCCAPFCSTVAADPCPGAAPGVECVPWWEPGQEPMDGCTNATVGACVLPQ